MLIGIGIDQQRREIPWAIENYYITGGGKTFLSKERDRLKGQKVWKRLKETTAVTGPGGEKGNIGDAEGLDRNSTLPERRTEKLCAMSLVVNAYTLIELIEMKHLGIEEGAGDRQKG